MLKSIASSLIAIVSLTSCRALTGVKTCGPELRVTGMLGNLAIGTGTAHAGLSLWENREPGRPETETATIDVFAQSDSLRQHMTSAELRDLQTPSRVFGSFTPPAVMPLPPNLFGFDGPYAATVPVEDFRALMLSGQLVLDIHTDIPNESVVRIPLTVLRQNDGTFIRETGESCG
jgi:hypothetical protein